MTLVQKIKELCAENATNFAALERNLDFGQGSIRKWDNAIPAGDRLAKVADYFGVSVDYLLGRNEDEVYDVDYSDDCQGINYIGEYLKESRESRGKSLKELSQDTSVAEKILKQYESGEREVKSNIFNKILKSYELTELDFQDEHNILTYEAGSKFNGDYNRSFEFEKSEFDDIAKEHNSKIASIKLSSHEENVIAAYRKHPEMQPAVDKILGLKECTPLHLLPNAAHENENATEEDKAHDEQFWDDFED